MTAIDRRWLFRALAAGAATALAGCDRLSRSPSVVDALKKAETLTRRTHRMILARTALAPEFTEAEISPDFLAAPSRPRVSRIGGCR
jgi:hypothetical protein